MVTGLSPGTTNTATGWGLVTHTTLTQQAINRVEASWVDIFVYYSIELHQGALNPDTVLQDWDNHLYYPNDPTNKTGPQAIQTNLDLAIGLFTTGDWAEGFFKLGKASHYMEDMNIPIHTGEFFGGDTVESPSIHSKIEKDINTAIDGSLFSYSPRAVIELNSSYTAKDLAVDQATAANGFRDDVMSQYTHAGSNQLFLNSTYFDMIENQMNEAIFSIGTLFKAAVNGLTVPTLPARTALGKTLIDTTHNNDYADGDLTQTITDLNRSSDVMLNFPELTDIDTLVITIPGDAFTTAEITAITTWLAGGERNIILSSKADLEEFARSSLNDILIAIGAQIRVNDDSVYTTAPDAYYPAGPPSTYYVDTQNVATPESTHDITEGITEIQMYRPSSLYFTSTNENLTVLVSADAYSFQANENSDAIAHVWDNVADDTGGDVIPLGAAEIVGDDKIAVFGTTIFSNFDYDGSDGVQLIHNILKWFDEPIPVKTTDPPASSSTTSTTSTTPSVTVDDTTEDDDSGFLPVPFLPVILGLSTIFIATYRRKIKN